MGTKKVKISAVKRAAHVKNKKTPLTKKQQQKIAQQKSNKEKQHKNIFVEKAKKRDNLAQRKKQNKRESLGLKPLAANGSDDDDEDAMLENVADMLDGEDLEILHAKGSNRQRKRKAVVEETSGMEKAYKVASEHEKEKQKVEVNLLPIKSRDGEIITRSTLVDYIPKPKISKTVEDQTQSDIEETVDNDDGESVYEDSDDDIVNDETQEKSQINKNLVSTTDLLIARQQEIERQKYRIGIICSGILEKPEDKMRNFNALFELMDETNKEGTPNLLTVRKVALISVTEIFKDILPEYRVGQIDTKMQTSKSLC